MKKTKQLITAVAICLLAVFAPRWAMGQTTCSTRIMLGSHDTVIAPFTLSDTTRWYDFEATDSTVFIGVQADTSNAPIFRLELYTGWCSGLTGIKGDTAMGVVNFIAQGLSIGTHYKLKLTIDNPSALSVNDVGLTVKSMGGGGGGAHSLFLCDLDVSGLYGSIYSVGDNTYGQVGCSPIGCTPTQVTSTNSAWVGRRFSAVAVGSNFSLALDDQGHVWAWGRNEYGELGNGTYDSQFDIYGNDLGFPTHCNPELVPLGGGFLGDGGTQSEIIAISAGFEYALALARDGTVWGWGLNNFHQIGSNTGVNHFYYAFNIITSPVVIIQPPPTTTHQIIAISAGGGHALAMDNFSTSNSGHVWGWGYNLNGELGIGNFTNPITTPTEMVDIGGTGNIIALAISANGGLSWLQGQSMVIYDVSGLHRLAVCGANNAGQLGISGPNLSVLQAPNFAANNAAPGIGAIGGAREHSLAVDRDGNVWGAGQNWDLDLTNQFSNYAFVANFTQLSGLSNIRAVTGGEF